MKLLIFIFVVIQSVAAEKEVVIRTSEAVDIILPPYLTSFGEKTIGLDILNPVLHILPGNCSCTTLSCSCCSNFDILALNFQNKVCLSLEFVPSNFSLTVVISDNNVALFRNSLSASNPPEICIPIPILPPPLPPFDCCKTFSNIYFGDGYLNTCFSWRWKYGPLNLLSIDFGCLKLGPNVFQIYRTAEAVVTAKKAKIAYGNHFSTIHIEEVNG